MWGDIVHVEMQAQHKKTLFPQIAAPPPGRPEAAGSRQDAGEGGRTGSGDDGGWEAGPDGTESHVDCRKRTFIAFQSPGNPTGTASQFPAVLATNADILLFLSYSPLGVSVAWWCS